MDNTCSSLSRKIRVLTTAGQVPQGLMRSHINYKPVNSLMRITAAIMCPAVPSPASSIAVGDMEQACLLCQSLSQAVYTLPLFNRGADEEEVHGGRETDPGVTLPVRNWAPRLSCLFL